MSKNTWQIFKEEYQIFCSSLKIKQSLIPLIIITLTILISIKIIYEPKYLKWSAIGMSIVILCWTNRLPKR